MHYAPCAMPRARLSDTVRKTRCCAKERERNNALKASFENLQNLIPYLPATRRVPRIKLLRLATAYIAHLSEVLESNGSSTVSSPQQRMEQLVRDEVIRQNSYKDRAEREIATKRKISSVPETDGEPTTKRPRTISPATENSFPLSAFHPSFGNPTSRMSCTSGSSSFIPTAQAPISVSIPAPPTFPPAATHSGPGILACTPPQGACYLPYHNGMVSDFQSNYESWLTTAMSYPTFQNDSGFCDKTESEMSNDNIDVLGV